jgi:transposase
MKRFIDGEGRTQVILLPECLDDYVEAENPVRVVEVFVDGLDLGELGFVGVAPAAMGRPAYRPAVLLKLHIYGYLNRIQSSRRLAREAQRNVELMWLTGRLRPDFKTIANFRKDNGRAIRNVCRQFMVLCRQLNLFTEAIVAIDGSKFKAVNNRDKNFTLAKMQRRMVQIEESIARYLVDMDTADRAEPEVAELNKGRLHEKIAGLKEQMPRRRRLEAQMLARPDQQLSLTDPDARSMKNRDGGIVGYNVQTAVDTKSHLIVAHEVVTTGTDRESRTPMAKPARAATSVDDLTMVADRGYFKGEQIRQCDEAGITPLVPKSMASNSKAEGRFEKQDFIYIASDDEYRLRTRTVADIARRLLVVLAKMMIQLGVQYSLCQRLFQRIDQAIVLKYRRGVMPRQQLVQQLLPDPGFRCHTPLLSVRLSYGSKTQNSLHPPSRRSTG